VNIAVCGKFHLLNYIPYLERQNVLNKLYFSHKLRSKEDYSIGNDVACNLPIKEYLLHAHGRLLRGIGFESMLPVYHSIWEKGVLEHWKSCQVLHILAQGTSRQLVRRAKSEGSRVIAEAVNTHPENMTSLYEREERRWSCSSKLRPFQSPKINQKILEDVHEADVLLVPSRTVADSFASRGIDKRTVKIPYGANLKRFFFDGQAFEARGKRVGALRVICVGAIGLRKGQLYLLEAARRLGLHKMQLTLVGAVSPEVQHLLPQYRDWFTHIERVPSERMSETLSRHDVFVLPSLEEGLAVSQCEAMACGLAVVTTREAGGEEILEDGSTGFLIEAASIDALANRLETLYADRETVQRVGWAAQDSVRKYYNWEGYANKLRELYFSLL